MIVKSRILGLGLIILLTLLTISSPTDAAAKAKSMKNGQSVKSWLRTLRAKRDNGEGSYSLEDTIPGSPGRDYPIFASAPDTQFSCKGRNYGYYADPEARCQVFHICANTAGDSGGFKFLCPNGTEFNQRYLVCDWHTNVDCDSSAKYYGLNDLIGDGMNDFSFNDIMSTARDMINFPLQQGGFGGGSTPDFSGNSGNGLGGGIDVRGSNGNTGNTGFGSPNANGKGSKGPFGSASGRPQGSGLNNINGGRGSPQQGSQDLSQFGPSSLGGSGGGSSNGAPSRTGLNPSSGSNNGVPSRNANANGAPSRNNFGPSSGARAPSKGGFGTLNGGPAALGGKGGSVPQRGANGEPVYVNSLGQLSTEDNAGFDPKKSFIIRPDKDSQFDQDFRIPSNSFDSIKGIGNSYSFGFPGDGSPQRGSADLSEPVDPSNRIQGGKGSKQIYTYPNDDDENSIIGGSGSLSPTNPEFTGAINTKLSAQSPKFPTSQVYAGFGPSQFGPSSIGGSQQTPSRGNLSPSGNQKGGFNQGSVPSRGSSLPTSSGSQNGARPSSIGSSGSPSKSGFNQGLGPSRGSSLPSSSRSQNGARPSSISGGGSPSRGGFGNKQSSGPSRGSSLPSSSGSQNGARPSSIGGSGSPSIGGFNQGSGPSRGSSLPSSSGSQNGARPSSISGGGSPSRGGFGNQQSSSPSRGSSLPSSSGSQNGFRPSSIGGSGSPSIGGFNQGNQKATGPSRGSSLPSSSGTQNGLRPSSIGGSGGFNQGNQQVSGPSRGSSLPSPSGSQNGFNQGSGPLRGSGQPSSSGSQNGFRPSSIGGSGGPSSGGFNQGNQQGSGPSRGSSQPSSIGGSSGFNQGNQQGSGPSRGSIQPSSSVSQNGLIPSSISGSGGPSRGGFGNQQDSGPSRGSFDSGNQQGSISPFESSQNGLGSFEGDPSSGSQLGFDSSNGQPLPPSYQPIKPGKKGSNQPTKLFSQGGTDFRGDFVAPLKDKYYQSPHADRAGPGQSNEDYLRVVLKGKENIHDDKPALIELIQRFFEPDRLRSKVVDADVHPSEAQESYSFSYDGEGDASNLRASVAAFPGSHNNQQSGSHSTFGSTSSHQSSAPHQHTSHGSHQHTEACVHPGY